MFSELSGCAVIDRFPLSRGSAAVYGAEGFPLELLGRTAIGGQVCDHRYYGVVHRTLGHDFSLFYLVLRDREGELRGVQPFFVVDQNILAGVKGKVADFAEKVRARYPKFLTLKTLMLGNPAGPGALGIVPSATDAEEAANRFWVTSALGEALAQYGAKHGVRIVVFKDFPPEFRGAMEGLLETSAGAPDFVRIPSMPMTGLHLAPYKSFEDFMTRALSKATRKNLRRKFKATADENIEMTVTGDIADCVDEVHRLYLQVYGRAGMKFEKLTPAYFLELARAMPERVRFFLWRRAGALIAVSITLVREKQEGTQESCLIDLYLGMEYPLALDLHMYFVTMRDIMEWCFARGIETYYSTPLNYDAKLHFRHRLVPQDLYVRHTSSILNPAFKFAMRFAEPTRHDKIIHQFPNAGEL
jgi:hypothetical protein